MGRSLLRKPGPRCLVCILILLGLIHVGALPVIAADHRDGTISQDQPADIADIYVFLDPADNSMLTLIMTARGFITPGEAENMGFFQEHLNWRFAIDTTADANPDYNVEITFSPRTGFDTPQLATVRLSEGINMIAEFDAPTTLSSATLPVPPSFVVTTDTASGIKVFAGMTDDPFFFDVPAELQFRESLRAGSPDSSVFDRGIDTFAGFNVMAVALSIPLSLIDARDNTFVGFSGYTEPAQFSLRTRDKGVRNIGRPINIDRMGLPAINTVLIPFRQKNRYNRGSTAQDAAGVYAQDIDTSLLRLNTNAANIALLISLVVPTGDMLRLDTTIANTGTNAAGFPNGRRLADDVIDIIVDIIANQHFANNNGIVDNVNANDKAFGNVFPFLAPPHQPAQ